MGADSGGHRATPGVAERAAEKVGAVTEGGGYSVAPKPNADVLVFAVSSRDREAAVRLANAYAGAFTEYRSELDTRSLNIALSQLGERLSDLQSEGQEDTGLYASLVEKEQQLKTLALLTTENTVVRPATGAVQTEPRPRRVALLGGILGLVLGLGIALLWETLDKRVRSEAEIEDTIGVPVLARLGEPYGRLRRNRRLASIHEPHSAQAEAFRMLRTTVEFANLELGARSILVTSAVQREGKSTTVANLAAALLSPADASSWLTSISANPRSQRSSGARAAGCRGGRPRGGGARRGARLRRDARGRVCAERSGTAGHERSPSPQPTLEVLAAGIRLPSDPSQFVASRGLADLLEQLKDRADLVLVDTPPVLAVGDAMVLSRQIDALLVVTRVEAIPRPALQQLRRVLDTTSAPTLGLVLTGSKLGASYGYGMYGYKQVESVSQQPPVSSGVRR